MFKILVLCYVFVTISGIPSQESGHKEVDTIENPQPLPVPVEQILKASESVSEITIDKIDEKADQNPLKVDDAAIENSPSVKAEGSESEDAQDPDKNRTFLLLLALRRTTPAATTSMASATTPVAGATTPVAGATTPVAGATTPVAGATTPVAAATTPVATSPVGR